MAEDNMNDLINNVKNMVDTGNIPENIQELLKNFSNSNSNSNSNNASVNINNSSNTSTENSSTSDSTTNLNNNFEDFSSSIDIGTILKMKGIIDSMNKKDDPRANLLYSLKPYLRSSRKDKLDQYVNLLNMTKIADVLKKEGGL